MSGIPDFSTTLRKNSVGAPARSWPIIITEREVATRFPLVEGIFSNVAGWIPESQSGSCVVLRSGSSNWIFK